MNWKEWLVSIVSVVFVLLFLFWFMAARFEECRDHGFSFMYCVGQ